MKATTKKSYLASELALLPDSDPLRRLMDLAAIARFYAQKHPDFANGYSNIVKKCDFLCCAFLDQCKTTHEVRNVLLFNRITEMWCM